MTLQTTGRGTKEDTPETSHHQRGEGIRGGENLE